VIGDFRFHRRSNAQCAMNAAEVVIREMQTVRGLFQALPGPRRGHLKPFLHKVVYHSELAFVMLPCENPSKNREPHGHLVQFYQADEPVLTSNVTEFLLEGLKQGDALLVITTPERNTAFARSLRESGIDPDAAVRERRLLFPDALQTLHRFMVDGQPDWRRFERTVGALIREVRPQPDHRGLRAYGEMVGLLWKEGQFAAAVRLEQFWNKLMSAHAFQLFCAYPIDVFGKDFQAAALDPVLCAHTHLVSAGRNRDLDRAVGRAMDEVLGPNVQGLRALIDAIYRPAWASMPDAETAILWLRNNLPEYAEDILMLAKHYYQGTLPNVPPLSPGDLLPAGNPIPQVII
jgi:hypothetical protein